MCALPHVCLVDYSGKRIGIVDPTTGEIREAEIFVGVLGASNLTYAEATWTQQLPDWTAHVRMFRFFGGASAPASLEARSRMLSMMARSACDGFVTAAALAGALDAR